MIKIISDRLYQNWVNYSLIVEVKYEIEKSVDNW
jgi:hypothetical protein